MQENEFSVVLTTAGSETQARELAEALVGSRLAACVNIVGPICSVFRWEGEIQSEEERLLVIKSRTALFPKIEKTILEVHSYDCPEIIQLPIHAGFKGYLGWLGAETATAE
jgi:periplasmic divalent cation tolerance protein